MSAVVPKPAILDCDRRFKEPFMKRCTSMMLVVIAVSTSMVSDRCSAAVVFDNGNHIGSGIGSAITFNQHAADDFLLPTTTTITDVHWKGIYGAGVAVGTDNFTIRIYADNSGVPTSPAPTSAIYTAAVGAANRAPTGETTQGVYTVYGYSAFISPFVALGGTTYWLEVFNNNPNDWYWSFDLTGGNNAYAFTGGSWTTFGGQTTFQLTNDGVGPLPEAASLLVWSILIGLVSLARKFRATLCAS
jgi:hypothetical protein